MFAGVSRCCKRPSVRTSVRSSVRAVRTDRETKRPRLKETSPLPHFLCSPLSPFEFPDSGLTRFPSVRASTQGVQAATQAVQAATEAVQAATQASKHSGKMFYSD